MSFEGEFASYEPLRRMADSDEIKALNSRMRIRNVEKESKKVLSAIIKGSDISDSTSLPKLLLAIDGSYAVSPVENGFPGAEEGYVTVASVLMDIEKLSKIEHEEFINPKEMRETETVSSVEAALPGSNLILDTETDSIASLRRVLFEILKKKRMFSDGETLLETYEHLFKIKQEKFSGDRFPKCPVCDGELEYNYGEYKCSKSGRALFSTDAMRLHELMHLDSSNGEVYGQIMSTLEKLVFMNILRTFEKKDWLPTLRQVAFFLDGPLAVFSTSSWLAKPIEYEIRRINEKQKNINGIDMMILGLEKTGSFFNHFVNLDTTRSGIKGNFPVQSIFLLNDAYIKKNIIYSDSTKPYGADTYFGRKFFYKTKTGQLLVPVVASYNDYERDISKAHLEQFSRLPDIIALLDKISSSRYPNSISPLILAHAEAAIPLNLGQKIFDQLSDDLRKKDEK